LGWTAMEVDPKACPSCRREQPGSGYLRAVNLPDRTHPRAAPVFHCAGCGRHIGKTRAHVLIGSDVICMRCWERRGYDKAGRMCSRAAAASLLGIWSHPFARKDER
jgi:hypothetical protein